MVIITTKVDASGAEEAQRYVLEGVPAYMNRVMARLARRCEEVVGAEARHNLSGGMWKGGPYAVAKFRTRIGRGEPSYSALGVSAGAGAVTSTGKSYRKTIYFWTMDPVSAIMELGSDKTWDILPRGVSQGWKSRRKYRDVRRKTRLGALHALKIGDRFVRKVTRRGLKRRPWLSQPIQNFVRDFDRHVEASLRG